VCNLGRLSCTIIGYLGAARRRVHFLDVCGRQTSFISCDKSSNNYVSDILNVNQFIYYPKLKYHNFSVLINLLKIYADEF